MPYALEPIDPRFDDRFRVRVVDRKGGRGEVCGEVARDEAGLWMAFVPGWPNGVPGFRRATGAAYWLVGRHYGQITPPPGFGVRARVRPPSRAAYKRVWRRRRRWARLAAAAERADPRRRPEDALRWALAVVAAAAEGRASCSFERADGGVAAVDVTRDEVRAARAWLAGAV